MSDRPTVRIQNVKAFDMYELTNPNLLAPPPFVSRLSPRKGMGQKGNSPGFELGTSRTTKHCPSTAGHSGVAV